MIFSNTTRRCGVECKSAPNNSERYEILEGWDDIASFLGVTTRTAATYVRLGMPIKRTQTNKVWVTKGDLYDWKYSESQNSDGG